MLAIKETGIVKNHKLEIFLPFDFEDGQVEVFIVRTENYSKNAKKEKLRIALDELAKCESSFTNIDPIDWQKEARTDNVLPELNAGDTIPLNGKIDFQSFNQKWAGVLKEDVNYNAKKLEQE